MSLFKCKMCGGSLEVNAGESVVTCEYCGTQQTLPNLDDDKRANMYDRANHFRRNNEFDKAMGIYEQILNEDNTDAEAYWSLVLCRYGIEYVEDPVSHKRIPTVNRTQFTSIFDDDNYKSALQYADGYQRAIYEAEAKTINEIQKGILAISQKEEPFDVFICYKESDNSGRRTPDSVLAQDLYYQLKQEGFKVFFARITLEDKLGSAYEPYIFAALNSAKVMVVLGTKPEFFNAVWVKNEWSRYLALIKQGQKKMLIPAYKDMDPYDLPEEFSHLQAQDMSKLGFMQDLIRGIKKIAKADEPKTTVVKETVVSSTNANVAPLLKRAFMFLEDGDFERADDFCEQVLNQDPENAQAYLGKLMSELRVKKQEALKEQAEPFDNSNNYQKAVRFADEKLKTALTGYIEHIDTRNENARLDSIYVRAKSAMSAANTESAYKEAAQLFEFIGEYENSASLAKECRDKAEADRLEKERLAEIARKEAEKRAKRNKKIAIITTPIVCAMIAFIIVLNAVIIPNDKYNDAIALMDAGKYSEAILAFEALKGYKDSANKIIECNTAILNGKYNDAIALMNAGKYSEAKLVFEALYGYKDSATKIAECNTAILNGKYNDAIALMNAGKYSEAILAFEALYGYKDSEDKITECNTAILNDKYNDAIALMNAGKYSEAKLVFQALYGYKDSATKITECNTAILNDKYNDAVALMNAGKYSEAILAFEALKGYKDSANKITECKYNDAIALMDAGKYSEAILAFEALGGYKDSEDKITECNTAILNDKYNDAIALMNAGKYSEAILAFEALGGYKDSANKITECKYNDAIALMDAGKYSEAKLVFEALGGYKDSVNKIEECNINIYGEEVWNKIKSVNVGDTYIFGSYEQDNNKSNGQEDIEWLVLSKEGTRIFVISKYALDCKQYNTSYTNVTWQNSTLRKWLNNGFINAAFSVNEQAMIPMVTVSADKNPIYGTNPGNATQDQVFLLSITEVNKYFSSDSARQCQPTDYAVANGASSTYGPWWLRTPGGSQRAATCVHLDGGVNKYGYAIASDIAVRPALWIDLNS